jgi:FixJ family two-component response regulator
VLETSIVCIVDDDEDVRMSLESFLRSTGTSVLTFASAESFLRFEAKGAPGCLITDLHMPGMDGMALQEELARRGRHYPVIVMTAYPTHDVKRESLRLGAAAFFAKPLDPEVLLERVEELLG